ncbi:MAG: alpha/beta fold hydrolase [Janthinobacterium lividum]
MKTTRLSLPGDGLALVADAYGDTAAPPVLFFHGGGQGRRSWNRTAQLVARHGFRGITVDLRGHGESDWATDGDYHVEAYARDVERLLDWAGRPASLVGASRGGQAALIGAARHAGRASMVMLADVVPGIQLSGVSRVALFLQQSLAGFASADEAADSLSTMLDKPRLSDSSGLSKVMRTGNDGRLYWQWDPASVRPEFLAPPSEFEAMEQAARTIACPVIMVRGSLSDMVTPDAVERFREMTPGLITMEVEGVGHMFTGDTNDAFATALLDQLRRFVQAPAAR